MTDRTSQTNGITTNVCGNNENRDRVTEFSDRAEHVLKMVTHEALEPHNRSIKWTIEAVEAADAKLDIGGESRRYGAESFAIRLTGRSGVMYRISVHFRPRFARLLAERFDEIDFEDESSLPSLMQPFHSMLSFETHWYDARDGDWEGICIHERRGGNHDCWPGDVLVTLINTLADDLRSAFAKKMTTLRSELRSAYPIAWCAHQTSPEVPFSYVARYTGWLDALGQANDEEDFRAIRRAAIADLFDEEVKS
jgi:hypothetical protein